MTDHRAEISAQAEAYLDELRAAVAAAHERLKAGVMRLQSQDEPLPEADPIFATRRFDVPQTALDALVNFDE